MQCCNEFTCDLYITLLTIKLLSFHCVYWILSHTFLDRGGCGYGSESEGEEPADSRVTLPQNVQGRGNIKAQQSAIRLTEVLQKVSLLGSSISSDSLFAAFFIYHFIHP